MFSPYVIQVVREGRGVFFKMHAVNVGNVHTRGNINAIIVSGAAITEFEPPAGGRHLVRSKKRTFFPQRVGCSIVVFSPSLPSRSLFAFSEVLVVVSFIMCYILIVILLIMSCCTEPDRVRHGDREIAGCGDINITPGRTTCPQEKKKPARQIQVIGIHWYIIYILKLQPILWNGRNCNNKRNSAVRTVTRI